MPSMEQLVAPLESLPPVEFAFAYGSGVFPQDNNTFLLHEAPMVDYILAVSCPSQWHSENLETNPHHYSSMLAYLGGKTVANMADIVGVGVHFNAFVHWGDKTIKYGVIGLDRLVQDIFTWKALYISGRLQKPVRVIVDNAGLEKANRVNLQAAVCAALLLLPQEFSEEDLYTTICSLSYMGDVRLFFAEDRNKVRKVVRGSSMKFHKLYQESLYQMAAMKMLELPAGFGKELYLKLVQDVSTPALCSLITSLPSIVLQKMAFQFGVKPELLINGNEEVVNLLQRHHRPTRLVRQAISGIVRTSSFRQMLSGFFASRSANATHYVIKKISKAWYSRH
ncbi:hypothetical protein O6H91_06G047700 [Diphasiastrum complanatum]|uniref:Uncharacterized protein n=1 Tax=Diphasiastrum complanatum TaxID=34168 RepID=A0ACC2DD56_DIPCM|nr:hypothetical protein O6H91_06G047700 [Diphasiastrum complanatum]